MFELVDAYSQSSAVIRVIGIGGGGGNAVEHMLTSNIEGVEFVCALCDFGSPAAFLEQVG